MLPSVLINSVAISSIALGTERPSLRSGNHWKCCWQAGKERATTNQPVRALRCQEIIQGWIFPLDFRFLSQCSSPAKGLPAPARAAMATARLRKTLDFLSTIFQTPTEIRAHSRRMIGRWGRRRNSKGVRGSFLLGLVTPRIAPSVHIKKKILFHSMCQTYFIQMCPVCKSGKWTYAVRKAGSHSQVHKELGEGAKTSTHIHCFKILFSFQNCHKSEGDNCSRLEILKLGRQKPNAAKDHCQVMARNLLAQRGHQMWATDLKRQSMTDC